MRTKNAYFQQGIQWAMQFLPKVYPGHLTKKVEKHWSIGYVGLILGPQDPRGLQQAVVRVESIAQYKMRSINIHQQLKS